MCGLCNLSAVFHPSLHDCLSLCSLLVLILLPADYTKVSPRLMSGELAFLEMKEILLLSILSTIPPLCRSSKHSEMGVNFSSWYAILIAASSIAMSFFSVIQVRFLYRTSVSVNGDGLDSCFVNFIECVVFYNSCKFFKLFDSG